MEKLQTSRNYKTICPDTLQRVYERELERHPKTALASAKKRLHALTGAYIGAEELKKVNRFYLEFADTGDASMLNHALLLHSSTRERYNTSDALYAKIRALCGKPKSVLDAACGLNPLKLGSLGYTNVLGVDIHGGLVELVNKWSKTAGWDVRAECMDVTVRVPEGEFDLLLAMKLLPVLETDRKGGALEFLDRVSFKRAIVTFPIVTLSGRRGDMEENYSEWFESEIAGKYEILDKFECGFELCYCIRRI